ncbi:MAG: lipoprotein [Pseudomonadota bacterium]
MPPLMPRLAPVIALLACLGLALSACGRRGDPVPPPPPEPAAEQPAEEG